MTKIRDLTGKTFGKLTVIGRSEQKASRVVWDCRCECGSISVVTGRDLVRKDGRNVTSCGCSRREDLTGQKFGRLTVIEMIPSKSRRGVKHLCKCECGNTFEAYGSLLKRGKTISCGCIHPTLKSGEAAKNKLFSSYVHGAEVRGYDFELTKDEFLEITQKKCTYCGQEPNSISSGKNLKGSYVYNGVDRIDNSKGYTKENTAPCCGTCNLMKRAMGVEEFIAHCKKIANHMK